MDKQELTTIELDEDFLEKLGIDLFEDEELEDFDYSEYLSERRQSYLNQIESNKYNDHSPFLVSDKSMRVVRKFGIKTSIGNPIYLGDQLGGMELTIPGFYQVPDVTFYMIYKESEVDEFGELVDNIWTDFIEDVSENQAVKWHDFYDEYYFMSMQEKYYLFLKNANNINKSHNIFDYL